MLPFRILLAASLLWPCLLVPQGADAAESYDSCTGFIASVPATITTQGVWCLRNDLSTSISSGAAITIAVNNVTIDCNDFKLGGLAAGSASQTYGIAASSRQNATVRNCSIRGFYYGVSLTDGAGNLVEYNRLDNNLRTGIYVTGENNLVQHNRVYDTGGATGHSHAFGIAAAADIINNTVSGVFAVAGSTHPHGISMLGAGTEALRNRISRLEVAGGGEAVGISAEGNAIRLSGNHIALVPAGPGTGVSGFGLDDSFCTGNTVWGFATAITNCDGSDNLAH